MEYNSSSEDLKDESPSQEGIGYTHPIKLDLESVDDFEHITKEVSPSKEVTAQFLHHETAYASNQNLDQNRPDIPDDHSYNEEYEEESQGLPPANSDSLVAESSSLLDNKYNPSEPFIPQSSTGIMDPDSGDDEAGSSRSFTEYERMHETNKGNDPLSLMKETTSEDDKLIDIESSATFDDFPVKAGDTMFSNNSEILMPHPQSDIKNSPPTVISQSLPGIIKSEIEAPVHSEKKPQGDGFHLTKTSVIDTSDTEENAPEPPAKDYPEIGVIEPKDFLSAIGIDNWFHPERLNPKVESLIYWRNVRKSAIAFGSGLSILFSLCYFSLISVVAYTCLTILAGSVSLKVYQHVIQAIQKSPDTSPLKANLEKILNFWIVKEFFDTLKDFFDMEVSVKPEKIREIVDTVVEFLNNLIIELRRRFLIEDIVDTAKFGIILWAMTYIGSWFNGLSLLIIGYVALFTIPKVYENNKTTIDANLNIAKEKINVLSDLIRGVIRMGKKEESKSKDE